MNKFFLFLFILTAMAIVGYDETANLDINDYTRNHYETVRDTFRADTP
jgi:hypothetical protein